MAKIFWIASYPKSGNTWIKILLANYLQNSHEPADINKLEFQLLASARIWFDEMVGIESSMLDNDTIENLRPGVYRCLAKENEETLYMKAHDAWTRTGNGDELFPNEVTAGVVYVIRNPLDMATSCANHWGVSLEQAVEYMNLPTSELATSTYEMAEQLTQKLGTWSHHVTSWIEDSSLPVHLVRYEDLRSTPESTFGKVVRFCKLPWDADRVRRAVVFSDFSELQRQEKKNDFRERSPKSSDLFFRRGEVGAWREELPDRLVQRIIDAHGDTMRRFGYLDENNQPV